MTLQFEKKHETMRNLQIFNHIGIIVSTIDTSRLLLSEMKDNENSYTLS